MAMTIFSVIKNSKWRGGIFACAAIVLSATTTHAGFEWVPAEPKAAPPAAVENAPIQPTSQDLLSSQPSATVQAPAPRPAPTQPEVLSPLPDLPPLPGETVSAPPKPAPARIKTPTPQPSIQPAAQPQNVMKVKRMDSPAPLRPEDRMSSKMMEELDKPSTPNAETLLAPVESPAPAEEVVDLTVPPAPDLSSMDEPVAPAPVSETRVIMPEDAPSSARKSVEDQNTMTIRAYPEGVEDDPVEESAEASLDADGSADEVIGFGNDMPLALALQQIAPAGYAFSFGENINPGAKVSWTGGKSWVAVMQDMIAPLGLEASVRGKAILIRHPRQTETLVPSKTPETPSETAEMDAEDAPITLTEAAQPETLDLREPASGAENTEPKHTAVTFERDVKEDVRRHSIKDPGDIPQQQPEETISLLEDAPEAAQAEQQAYEVQSPSKPRLSTIWEAEKGDSLKQTLSLWSKKGNFDLEWDAPHDYTLESDILVAGRLDNALKALISNGVNPETGPAMTFIESPSGEKTSKLVISGQS